MSGCIAGKASEERMEKHLAFGFVAGEREREMRELLEIISLSLSLYD